MFWSGDVLEQAGEHALPLLREACTAHAKNPVIAAAPTKDAGMRYFKYEAALLLALINSSSIKFGQSIPIDALRGSKSEKVKTSKIKIGKGKGK
jgi:hypothetical protein